MAKCDSYYKIRNKIFITMLLESLAEVFYKVSQVLQSVTVMIK